MLRIAFVEWPEALSTSDYQWGALKDSVTAASPDILLTNELPFGSWLSDTDVFSEDEANVSLRDHEKGLEGLIDLNLPRHHLNASGVERKTTRQRSICA